MFYLELYHIWVLLSTHMDEYFFIWICYYIYKWEVFGGSMDILKKINKMRLDRNWSIYRLSIESDIPQSTLTNMFNRETLPSITTLSSICSAFGISLSDFFAEENSSNEYSSSDKKFLDMFNSASKEAREAILCLLREINKDK